MTVEHAHKIHHRIESALKRELPDIELNLHIEPGLSGAENNGKKEIVKHELLFLGLLKNGPKHPYEIKKILLDELSSVFQLEIKSIYYPLEKLKRKGLVIRKTCKIGRRPQRYVYELTEKGEIRFKQILKENFLKIERPYFNIDLSLYFLKYLEPEVAKRMLLARTNFLKRIQKD